MIPTRGNYTHPAATYAIVAAAVVAALLLSAPVIYIFSFMIRTS